MPSAPSGSAPAADRTPKANVYATGPLDRADHLRRDAGWLSAALAAAGSRFAPVWRGHHLFVESAGGGAAAVFLSPDRAAGLLAEGAEACFLGLDGEDAVFALDLSHLETTDHVPALAGMGDFADLRQIGPLLPAGEGAILAHARAMAHWHGRHRFCGLCGHPTTPGDAGYLRRCTNESCGAPHFPRTDPAVIMLVHDGGERCVLGRSHRFPPGMHSTLAGFVEPGESLEDAVAREVLEEVGLRVRDVTYNSSQPWPFPSSLMLGFHACADFGELRIEPEELESARWFTRAELLASPEDERFRLPRPDSIARRLIRDWLDR
jgi:NAD+ diphosphatase